MPGLFNFSSHRFFLQPLQIRKCKLHLLHRRYPLPLHRRSEIRERNNWWNNSSQQPNPCNNKSCRSQGSIKIKICESYRIASKTINFTLPCVIITLKGDVTSQRKLPFTVANADFTGERWTSKTTFHRIVGKVPLVAFVGVGGWWEKNNRGEIRVTVRVLFKCLNTFDQGSE